MTACSRSDLYLHWIQSLCLCYFCGRKGAKETDSPAAISSCQWQSTDAGPGAEREAVKRSELLACSSKHSLLVRGPSKGQYSVTSQKLDSWVDATRSKWRQRGAQSCLSVAISLHPAPLISLSLILIKRPIFHFILQHLSWCRCAPPFLPFHFWHRSHPRCLPSIFPSCLCYNARITKLLGFKLRNLVGNQLCLHYARKTTGVSFRSCLKPLPLEQILQGVQFIWCAFWRQSSLWWLRMHDVFCGSPFKNRDLHKAARFMEWQRNASGSYKFNQMIPSYVQRACYRKSNS